MMTIVPMILSAVLFVAILYMGFTYSPATEAIPGYARCSALILLLSLFLAVTCVLQQRWSGVGMCVVTATIGLGLLMTFVERAARFRETFTDQQAQDVLEIADLAVPLSDIASWSAVSFVAAVVWAVREHDIANDNDLPRIPKPGILQGYQSFSEDWQAK